MGLFLNNSDKVHGKDPTQFDRDQNDRNAEKKYISSTIESIHMVHGTTHSVCLSLRLRLSLSLNGRMAIQ